MIRLDENENFNDDWLAITFHHLNSRIPCLVVDVEVDPLLNLGPERAGLAGVLADVEVSGLANVER